MRRERGVKARWSGPSSPEGNLMSLQGVTAGLRLSWVEFLLAVNLLAPLSLGRWKPGIAPGRHGEMIK